MNLIEVAKKRDDVMASPPITCSCGEKWYSPFDKLYVTAYGKCTECSTDSEIEGFSENIFKIIEG